MTRSPEPSFAPPAGAGWAVVAALALRLIAPSAATALARDEPLFREPDTVQYVENGQSLLDKWALERQGQIEIVRTPGYPLLLVPGLWLGRLDSWVFVVQAVAGAATVWLTARIAVEAGLGARAARWAAWLMALEPLGILYSIKLLTDVPFTAVLTAVVYLLQRYSCTKSIKQLLTAAAFLAMAAFLRPIGYYLPAVLGPCVAVAARQAGCSWGASLARGAVFFVVAFTPLAAWRERNARLGNYPGFSAISDIDLYFLHAAAVKAAVDGRSFGPVDQMDEALYFAEHPEQRGWPLGRVYAAQGREARAVLMSHPWISARIQMAGMWRVLWDNGTQAALDMVGRAPVLSADDAAIPRSQPWRRFWRACSTKPLMVVTWLTLQTVALFFIAGAILGLISHPAWRRPGWWLPLVVALVLIMLSGGPVGRHRFRLPVQPVLATLAAAGWLAWGERFTASRRPPSQPDPAT